MPHACPVEISDPRLDPYRDLKRPAGGERRDRFIVEGRFLVERLLASDLAVESVLATPAALEKLGPNLPAGVTVLVAPRREIAELVGFEFHRGVLACGVRPPQPALKEILAGCEAPLLLAAAGIADQENVGAIVRTAAAFGARAIILDQACGDPFSRRVVRVSMGAVFDLPVVLSRDISETLSDLQSRGLAVVATVADDRAEPLHTVEPPPQSVVLLGGEGYGLPPELLSLCDRRVTIPLAAGVDSLNVAVAAGVVLHHFSRLDG